jgi:hypothetical protein
MDITIGVSPKRCAIILGLSAGLLVAASVGASVLSLAPIHDPFLLQVRASAVRLVWLDGECNIPSWFSSALLLLCSFLLAVVAAAQRQRRDGRFGHWLALSLIFAFLSLDETAQLHELTIVPLRDTFQAGGSLLYPLDHSGRYLRRRVCPELPQLSGGAASEHGPAVSWREPFNVGGALGVEALSGKQAWLHGEHNVAYHAITTVKELLEMTGLVVFIYVLLDYISRQFGTLRIHVDGPSAGPGSGK